MKTLLVDEKIELISRIGSTLGRDFRWAEYGEDVGQLFLAIANDTQVNWDLDWCVDDIFREKFGPQDDVWSFISYEEPEDEE